MKGVHGVLEGRAGAEPEVTAQARQDQQSNPFALVKGDKTLASIPCPDPPQVAAKKRTNRDNGGVINEAQLKGDAAAPKGEEAEALQEANNSDIEVSE